MQTKTRTTSYDRVIATAEASQWAVEVTEVKVSVKTPKPENDSYRRRRYIAKETVDGIRVKIDNGVTPDGRGAFANGKVTAYLFFTKDGKFLADQTSGDYPFYGNVPLKDVLDNIERKSPAFINALRKRAAEVKAAKDAQKIADAEADVLSATLAVERTRERAMDALVTSRTQDDLGQVLDALVGPMQAYSQAQTWLKTQTETLGMLRAEINMGY